MTSCSCSSGSVVMFGMWATIKARNNKLILISDVPSQVQGPEVVYSLDVGTVTV